MAQTVMKRGPVSGTAIERAARKRKPFLIDLYGTAVGKKYVMAITGLIGLGFVITHMIGNLKMYLGVITEGDGERAYDIDIYGEFLRELAVPLLPRMLPAWISPRGPLPLTGPGAMAVSASMSISTRSVSTW